MTPDQITLVQSTWKQVAPIRDLAAVLFYSRLFELDPSLRKLFPPPLDVQGKKLMSVIGTAVGCLGRMAEIVPTMQEIGRRHAGYGTHGRHYDTMEAALLWTLAELLDKDFTPEANEAWSAAYGTLANVMKDAANDPAIATAVA